jgi:hypothetical protein
MDSLEYVKTHLLQARENRGAWKAIAAATEVPAYAIWRIATGKTANPGVKTVEALRRYFEAAQ